MPPRRKILDGKENKTRRQLKKEPLHAYIEIEIVIPLWLCSSITVAALPSAAET